MVINKFQSPVFYSCFCLCCVFFLFINNIIHICAHEKVKSKTKNENRSLLVLLFKRQKSVKWEKTCTILFSLIEKTSTVICQNAWIISSLFLCMSWVDKIQLWSSQTVGFSLPQNTPLYVELRGKWNGCVRVMVTQQYFCTSWLWSPSRSTCWISSQISIGERNLSSAANPQDLSFTNSGVSFRHRKLVCLCFAKPH